MAGLLLLGLLACVSMSSAQPPSVVITEQCYHPLELDDLEQELENTTIRMLPIQDLCTTHNQLLSDLSSLSEDSVVVASLEPALCSPAYLLARLHNRTLVTWNCPQDTYETGDDHFRVSPSIKDIATALAELVINMRWKPVALISSELGWWPSLAHSVDIQLRRSGLIARHYFMIPQSISRERLKTKFLALQKNPCRAAIIFSPANTVGRKILEVLDELELSKDHDTLFILVDVSSLPAWLSTFHPPSRQQQQSSSMLDMSNNINNNVNNSNNSSSALDTSIAPMQFVVSDGFSGGYNDSNFANKISFITRNYVLVFTETTDLSLTFNYSLTSVVVANIKRAFGLLEPSNPVPRYRKRRGQFVLLDLKEDFSWRPLLGVSTIVGVLGDGDNVSVSGGDFHVTRIYSNLEEWVRKHKHIDYCEWCPEESEFDKTVNVFIILACSCLFVAFLLGVAAVARNQLLKKRVTKGPYKVVLAATDFVFPQISDHRRVDEGIEAMLCCWLQQLQEFGGPEVDKPDLLQGSGGSLRTPLKGGSSPSLAKTLIVDPRVRYNGDLVQMKPLPSSATGVELRTKAVEVLVLLHGLRHENLNPFIGCLADPPRAALVHEWCARGSLQDVLQQDEIKLDWSFRLSLLTDLVRGMRHLHSTPIRVHGYLTSRNCVIDARWVLKITDYGLPLFYESQGIQPPSKSARELLWTAPELLRHAGLRKKGTQPGDVYSFGIILQEVVVRGEPFCMLANTPEEIIDKLKRPPPLIRPSVSKGAAPPEAINIMRQCWAELPDMRPDFNTVHDLFKKLNHGRKVNFVDTMFQMLEKYSNNLEELIRERTEQLDIEKKKTEQLLNRMLPSTVADKLKLGMPVDPEQYEEVTIYFSDIVGFTTISAHSTPFQVVDLLNDLYTCFDATINAYSVYKVETIGDAYMVVGGLPVRIPDHAEQVATMALDLLHQSGKFRIRHLPGTSLRLRIGLHTGPCCSGVVGLTMPRYCLFGDTVNTASRMESSGAAWRIHMSQETKDHLEKAGGYQIEYRGLTNIKGKGRMHTYWLLGKSGFDKTLPVPPPLELDESLIICDPTLVGSNANGEDASSGGSSEGAAAPRNYEILADIAVEQAVKSPLPDPTFMKSMECSKFSALLSNQTKCDETLKAPSAPPPQPAPVEPPPVQQAVMVKSTSSDTTGSLGMPVSASEVAAALLGASTQSLCGFKGRHIKMIEEEDLSTPYNHYRCLSPTEKPGRSMLRRQFSLDRTEEIKPQSPVTPIKLKLCKQNSAGAADLERIEETVTPTNPAISPCHVNPPHCSLSISVDSLTIR